METSVSAFAEALIYLGISPVYHVREVGKNQHAPLWTEAIEAIFEENMSWGREEFDSVMGEYEVVSIRGKGLADYPAAIFPGKHGGLPRDYCDLDGARRRAEVARLDDVDVDTRPRRPQLPIEPVIRPGREVPLILLVSLKYRSLPIQSHWHRTKSNDFPQHGLPLYHKHNQILRDAASRRGGTLLENRPGQGWVPLCELLGLSVPAADGPYPRADDRLDYEQQKAKRA
ncbi:hypothetical protein PG993_001785 [Apiospora rasikravindrae]|uniref:Uncharacterized protein n=1 Tax=Apiospora rasikravindrae TaxID=990691 RepID=A0ABR1UCC8_9PEZI